MKKTLVNKHWIEALIVILLIGGMIFLLRILFKVYL